MAQSNSLNGRTVGDNNVTEVKTTRVMESLKVPKSFNVNGNICGEWRRFIQNFEIFMKAGEHCDKPDDVKVAILLNCIGEDGVELFNTFPLNEEQRKRYSLVVEEFEKYANPRRNVVIERYTFNSRNQKEHEPFDEFFTELRKLVKYCDYGDLADTLIRDRIVVGLMDKSLTERLLRESELTLQKTIEICRAAEVSKKQCAIVHPELDLIKKRPYPKPKEKSMLRTDHNQRSTTSPKDTWTYLCKKCNTNHSKRNCPAYGQKCNSCRRLGHFAVGCKFKPHNHKRVSELTESLEINNISNNITSCWTQVIKVCGKNLSFKLDTGAAVNILPHNLFNTVMCKNKLKGTNMILEAFGGTKIKPLGSVHLECCVNNVTKLLEFVIVHDKIYSKPLLGLASCVELGLIKKHDIDTAEISCKNTFIDKNIDLFEGTGTFNTTCSIKIDENVEPIVKPPRRIPETVKAKLKEKLCILEKDGIISKVESPEGWVNNLVIVEKTDGSIRVCLDPQDLNKVIKREYHLIPTVEELVPKLCNKSIYTVFDLKDGFYQIKLDDKSSELCKFNSPFGCYKFNRLPFGISVAPEIFQKYNEKNFGDIPGVVIYFDDMLICADNEKEHDVILNKVVERARKLNVKFNPKKLQYRVNEVKYLGFVFNKCGMKPDPEHVKAIMSLEAPSNKKELQRILGMVNYLRKFIPNMSEVTAPLRELLKTSVHFDWLSVHNKALDELKNRISKAPILGNFNSNKEITLQCDSSKSGLGCCLLQDGQPVSFASRALSEAEQNYAQIEKEYLSIVFATKKFHNFIYGKKVIVHTDHKPLVSIHKKDVVKVMSSRLQRMKLKLLKYDLNVMYVPGKYMYVADLLSRSYINECDEDDFLREIVHCVKAIRHIQVTDSKLKQFQECTVRDPVLNVIMSFCKNGWPSDKKDVPAEVRFYFKLRSDIFVEDDIVFLNGKIVVPVELRKEMLCKIHESHFGMEKSKLRAREILYWPGMSDDIEKLISRCSVCEKYSSKNCKEPLMSHEIMSLPFEKVGCDICEFGKNDYFVLIDYLTKWLEIVPIANKQASEIIDKLKVIFSTHGIPRYLVADNMPFSSLEFKKFSKEWDFEIINSSPRYPKSNGQAESAVKIAKSIIKKCYESNRDIYSALMEYRNTPIKIAEFSPSQALMSRRVRTKIPMNKDLLKPEVQLNVKEKIVNKQNISKWYYDKSAKPLSDLYINQNVLIRNGKTWERGIVVKKDKNPRSYWVKTQNSRIVRRNRVHLKPSENKPYFDLEIERNENVEADKIVDRTVMSNGPNVSRSNGSYVTRSGRIVKPPDRYGYSK